MSEHTPETLDCPVAQLENEIEANVMSICLTEENVPFEIRLSSGEVASLYMGAGGRTVDGYATLWCAREDRDFVCSLLQEIRTDPDEENILWEEAALPLEDTAEDGEEPEL
ncbi:MAG: hypothetical protein K6B40_05420 [Firmicutes bacterium]|nr:hypothetical protein [Bacillota bacterium]